MPTDIALFWNENALHYVVARDGRIETASHVALQPGLQPAALGQRLAEVLAPYSPGRAKVVVALGRGALEWQHLSLPPCPAEELPDVVQLQADRDLSPTDEGLGFDFLQLLGDEQTPQEVLTVALAADELAKVRHVCRAANLTLERIVPLAAGWPAITRQASGNVQPGTHLFVAPLAHEATLWATRAGRVVLFRQFQLATDNPTDLAEVVGSELRRTLLALSQHADNSKPAVSLVGHPTNQLQQLANSLDEQLEISVQSLDVAAQHLILASDTSAMTTLPLVGLAIDEAQGNQPLVDLLHPHRRPQKKINVRTYVLAATAGVLLLALLGWSSYAKLQAPLNQAAEDQAELTLLEEPLVQLKAYEQRAAAIRDWKAEAPNLLLHLEQVSKSIRPNALEDKDFGVEQDVVLEKLDFEKRQLTLDALARNSRAVQPLEARLRALAYRTQRGRSDKSETLKEYPWHFISTIEITTASDPVENSASDNPVNEVPVEEPQS